MRCAFLGKSAQSVTVFLVREKFRESTKLSIERGWDRFPRMGRCPGKSAGQFNLRANRSLSFLYRNAAHNLCHPPGSRGKKNATACAYVLFLCRVMAHEANWRCTQRKDRGRTPVQLVLSAGADSLRSKQSAARALSGLRYSGRRHDRFVNE